MPRPRGEPPCSQIGSPALANCGSQPAWHQISQEEFPAEVAGSILLSGALWIPPEAPLLHSHAFFCLNKPVFSHQAWPQQKQALQRRQTLGQIQRPAGLCSDP